MGSKEYIRYLHPLGVGNALGLMEALMIFTATIILYIQGDRGEAYLSRFFPFYEISPAGAFIGLIEGYIDGFIGGLILAFGYNLVMKLIKK